MCLPVGVGRNGRGPRHSETKETDITHRLFWIETSGRGRLAIAGRPRASDWLSDEIAAWRDAGVDTVVCLLESSEVAELGLQAESGLCRQHDIEFVSFPVVDRGVPASMREMAALAEAMVDRLVAGKSIVVHCRAGIGRSALVAACVLVRRGQDAESAFRAIETARGVRVPDTDAQRNWVIRFSEYPRHGVGL